MLRAFWKLILLLTLLAICLPMAGHFVEVVLAGVTGWVARIVGSVVSGFVSAAFVVTLAIGIVIRIIDWSRRRNDASGRARANEARRMRIRRPAEGVRPLEFHREHLTDPDPAVGENEVEQ